MAYLSFEHVYKTYQSGEVEIHALDDINFQVEQGEFCVILGASGAGKTTLLNMLGGMDQITSGDIILDGKNIAKLDKKELVNYRRYDVGFVFQFYNLVPNLTAKENVEIAAMLCPNPIDAEEALRMVGLSQRADNFPAQLSGGEQQRVAIARAIAKNPRLLLCDEPTGALDFVTGKAVLETLYTLGKTEGRTTFVITHNQAIAGCADRIIQIRSGKILSNERNEHRIPVSEITW